MKLIGVYSGSMRVILGFYWSYIRVMLGFRILVRPVLAVSGRGSRPCQEAKKKIPPELLQQLDEAMHYQCKVGSELEGVDCYINSVS